MNTLNMAAVFLSVIGAAEPPVDPGAKPFVAQAIAQGAPIPVITEQSPGRWPSRDDRNLGSYPGRMGPLNVFQVIDKRNMIVKPRHKSNLPASVTGRWELLWVEGVPTDNIADGDEFEPGDTVFKLDGTKAYQTAGGAQKTIHLMRVSDGGQEQMIERDLEKAGGSPRPAHDVPPVPTPKPALDPSQDPDVTAFVREAIIQAKVIPQMTDHSPGSWNGAAIGRMGPLKVFQVVNADTMIVQPRFPTQYPGRWELLRVEGLSTKGIADGDRFEPGDHVFKLDGTRTYQAADGGTTTIHAMRTWDATQAREAYNLRVAAIDAARARLKAEADLHAAESSRQARAAAAAAENARYRTWRDQTGKFAVEAEFVAFANDNVILRRRDNKKKLTLPLAKLAEDDQEWVRAKLAAMRGGGGRAK